MENRTVRTINFQFASCVSVSYYLFIGICVEIGSGNMKVTHHIIANIFLEMDACYSCH